MFRITDSPIAGPLLHPDLAAGGLVVFEGIVRNHNEGREVQALEYEAYEDLAVKEGERVMREALDRFPVLDAAAAHRVGLLQLGEVAIRVEVAAAHRREAFEACELIVDELKRRVPIWKKEHYRDGASDWINAQGTRVVTEQALYARQLRVPEVGSEGQRRLAESHVLVVGAGGLGCPAIQYLAGAGVGRITIVDPDEVDPTNLHRQPLYRHADVGRPKARLAAERARSQNPFVTAVSVAAALDASNVEEWVSEADVVLDCTDNFATKFLLNDACVSRGKPLVVASLHRFDGQLLTIEPEGPCLRCLWPTAPPDGCVGTCADDGVLGFVPGVFGALQAAEAVKRLLGMPRRTGEMALLDVRHLELEHVRVPRNPECPACGSGELPQAVPEPHVVRELDPGDLVVDIREPYEVEAQPVPGAVCVPLSGFSPHHEPLQGARRIVLLCEHGVRSRYLAEAMRQAGDTRYFSWVGGREHFLRHVGRR